MKNTLLILATLFGSIGLYSAFIGKDMEWAVCMILWGLFFIGSRTVKSK